MAPSRLTILSAVLVSSILSSSIVNVSSSSSSSSPLFPSSLTGGDTVGINGVQIGGVFARTLQAAQYHWSTEHHDNRNSGNSGSTGPGEATGVCKTTVRILSSSPPQTVKKTKVSEMTNILQSSVLSFSLCLVYRLLKPLAAILIS